MKKLLALALVVFGLAACQTEPEGFDVVVGGEVPVTVTVDLADAVGTRADSASGAIANEVVKSDEYTLRYALQVFNEDGTASKDIKYKYTDKADVAFDLRLVPGRNYKFVVWADIVDQGQNLVEDQKSDDLHYVIGNDLRDISINQEEWEAMDESRDAYTGVYDANNFKATDNITITLTRPFAKLRVVTTDIEDLFDGVVPAKAVATYTTEHRTSFDAFTQTAGEANLSGVSHEFDIADYYNDNTGNKTLFVDYFFAAKQDDVVNFSLDVKEADGTTIKMNTFNTDIPVKSNFLTTIIGNILTEGNKIQVDIDDNFGENNENQEVRKTISSYAELYAATTAGGKYIVIADIDVNIDGDDNNGASTTAARFAATRAGVETVIDLNGCTITVNNKSSEAALTIESGNSLTFTGEGTIELTSESNGSFIKVEQGAEVNIEGATIVDNSQNKVGIFGGNGDVVDYVALLEKAFAEGGEYTLPTDVYLSRPLTLAADKTLVLNLGGKTIKQTKACTGSYAMIVNNGNLTIAGEGKISFTDSGNGDPKYGWGSYTITNHNTLVVNGGTIENTTPLNVDSVVHMYCAIQQGTATAITTINGGVVSNPTYRSIRATRGEVVINGGKFEGQVWMQSDSYYTKLTINDGEFEPTGVDGSSVFITNTNADGADLAINGGFFNTKIGCSDATKEGVKGSIKGGTFTESAKNNTNANLIAEGYEAIEQNGVWVVTPSYSVEGNVYTIYTANGLAHFSDTTVPDGAVFNLAADIDMKNMEFKAIAAGYSKSFTFNGNNHTISNVNVAVCKHNTVGAASLFFCYPGGILNINDLYVDGVNIAEATYAGAILGYSQGAVTLNNVHVANSKINGVKKIGGIVGFVEASTSSFVANNCSVTNTTVTATEKQAATVVGYAAKPATFNNITVENSTADAPLYCLNDVVCDDPAQALVIVNGVAYVFNAATLQTAIKNGCKNVEFVTDITVDQWIMFSETMSIGSGQIITVDMNGLTIDGNGHTLTVNAIESATNGDNLFHNASNLTVRDLNIKTNCAGGAINLRSGVISNVSFEGGAYSIFPGEGEVLVEKCTFATATGDAVYFEKERDNLTITGCTFNQKDGNNVVLLRGDVKFTNNIVNSGRTVNIVSGSPVVTGNNFNDVRLKVYSAATATISNNIINNLVFEADTYSSTFADDNTLSPEAEAALGAATKN